MHLNSLTYYEFTCATHFMFKKEAARITYADMLIMHVKIFVIHK